MSTADALALLDLEGSERFAFPVSLVAAVDLDWETVAEAVEDDRTFAVRVAGNVRMPMREVASLRRLWRVQQGLVHGDDLRRLFWILGTFSREVESDLLQHFQVHLGDLWRKRQWRLLLNLIDHLPRTTWTQHGLVNHPDYAERVADAMAAKRTRLRAEEKPSTPLTEWTPEVAMMASLIDAVNGLRQTMIAVNLQPGKQPPKIEPFPRPRSLLDTMVEKKERALRWSAHERLTSQLLPQKK